jgi:hypothetical protein
MIPADHFRSVIEAPGATLKKREQESSELFCISFKHLATAQGQTFKQWQKEELLSKGMEALQSLCGMKMSQACSNAQRQVFKTYTSYPDGSMFAPPKHTPPDARWARAKFSSKRVIAGHVVRNVFFVVFLDKDHVFAPSRKKNT